MNSWDELFDVRRMAEEFAELKQEVKELRDEVAALKQKHADQLYIEAPLTGGFTPRNRRITV